MRLSSEKNVHFLDKIKTVLQSSDYLKELALKLHQNRSILVMGRGYNYATCLEGALKIKEITYMHSEGILAGELKHGPLALIDTHMPCVMVVTRDSAYVKCQNALQQVVARSVSCTLCVNNTMKKDFKTFFIWKFSSKNNI